MTRLRYRIARALVGRFVAIPPSEGDQPVVVVAFTDGTSLAMQPKAFRMKSRTYFPNPWGSDSDRTFGLPARHRTTFVGVVER